MIKVLHLSYSDSHGGAARAAYRLHLSLAQRANDDIKSELWVITKGQQDEGVKQFIKNDILFRLKKKIFFGLRSYFFKKYKTNNIYYHSIPVLETGISSLINSSDADIVNLHWLGEQTISIREIGLINKPIVWTLHDQWVFCGAEHISDMAPLYNKRYLEEYTRYNRPVYESGLDINKFVWHQKKRYWKNPMVFISPSKWMKECAEHSHLLKDKQHYLVPLPLDINIWKPIPKHEARGILNIDKDYHILLFGAVGGLKDPIKGGEYILQVIKILAKENTKIKLLIFGQSEEYFNDEILRQNIKFLGHLHDDISLRVVYSAADVLIVPSRLESFGQTATEAHACGTPVVAFNVGGLSSVIDHGVTGALAEPLNNESLLYWIKWVIEDKDRKRVLSENARKRAVENWSFETISEKYFDIYSSVLCRQK